jgi:multiple sugar transport system permease protein
MGNSIVVAVGTVLISMVVGILGAYAFARLRFRFRRAVLILFLATYMLPQIALLIPLYLILNSLELLDTTTGLIFVDCALVIPFVLWILSNYFMTIPDELEEAARIDGTTRMGALFYVVLPAARPGIFAAIMFAFLLAWDEFMYALIFTSSDAAKTLPVAISEFAGRYTTDFGLVAAGGILAALPPIIVAIIFQRYVVSGMAAGAVKG